MPNASELARVARFIGNGLFNTGLSYLLFVALLRAHMPVFIALLLSTGSTIVLNYFTSRFLVFRSKNSGSMPRFIFIYGALFIFNYLVLLSLKVCGVPSWLAQATVVLPIAALAYAAQRHLIFKEVGGEPHRDPFADLPPLSIDRQTDELEMYQKANVEKFNEDVLQRGVYRYTDSARDIAKAFSNSRTSRAIAQSTSFAGKTVLDVGCGDGIFTMELAALGAASILGIDPAAEAVDSAQARARAAGIEEKVQFQVFNIYDLSPSFGKFDIVLLRGVLHHLSLPEKALNAVATVCDEIIVLEPNGCNPILKLIERFSTYHVQHEEQSFLPLTINRWLAMAGKTPRKREIINLVPLFCHPALARLLKMLEPVVEATPILRLIGCGQYLVRAS